MKIQGILTIEGISLHVEIDAPDDARELYVTNVHPNCLVIPKERWKIEFLGLPTEIVATLHERNVFTLGELVDGHWDPRFVGLDEATEARIKEALTAFRKIALVFERMEFEGAEVHATEVRRGRPLRTTLAEAFVTKEEEKKDSPLHKDISSVGLLKPQEDALRKTKGVRTLGDLAKLGRARLLMTNQMDERGVGKIEATLRKGGFFLPP